MLACAAALDCIAEVLTTYVSKHGRVSIMLNATVISLPLRERAPDHLQNSFAQGPKRSSAALHTTCPMLSQLDDDHGVLNECRKAVKTYTLFDS